MDGSRFDGLARALGKRSTRRSTIAAAFAAATGSLVVAGDRSGAAVCTAKGDSCASVGCCAGLACDSKTKKCLGGPGATCKISSNCASGLKCRSGVCDGALVCRNLRESCVPTTSSCCSNLSCVTGKNVCLGMAGYSGCETDADCFSGLVCAAGACQVKPTTPPNPYGDFECDLIIQPGTDLGPLEDLDAGTTTCLAPGDHYFLERGLDTDWDGGGGSIYGAADGSTIVHVRYSIGLYGPGVLANLTIIQTADSYQPWIVRSDPGDGNAVLASNLRIESSSRALACFSGTTTVSNTTLTADFQALRAEGGSVILQASTMSGAETGIYISDGGTVTMDAASKIINNTGGADYGSAVYIEKSSSEDDGGAFTNNGGTISGNSSTGAVCDNDVVTYDWDEDYEPQCCTNAGNGKTGTCSIA